MAAESKEWTPAATAACLLELRDRIAELRTDFEHWVDRVDSQGDRIAALETHWHKETGHGTSVPHFVQTAQPQEEAKTKPQYEIDLDMWWKDLAPTTKRVIYEGHQVSSRSR